VEENVKRRADFLNQSDYPQRCGKLSSFPRFFHGVLHNLREKPAFTESTLLEKAESWISASSTFRIEWITVE
jgi:hypothetical protein